MKKIRYLAFLCALACTGSLCVGCKQTKINDTEPIDDADVVEHADDTSVYDMIGNQITVDMVMEDENGLAFVDYGGKRYELGMDFLSMAMVYNTEPIEGSEVYSDAEAVFHMWWKLYIQRWNYLVPEIPLYSNEYYDLYNAKISNFVTSPYWSPANAIVSATVTGDSRVILGSVTDLTGAFRNAAWGKTSPGSADLDIQNLITGHSTVMTDRDGSYIWNMEALAAEPVATKNADGTLTYTIELKQDLKFSDGSPITADNYLAALLCNSSPVGVAAGGTGLAGRTLVGYKEFRAYDGSGPRVYFEGVKKLGSHRFSVTFPSDYANYYYTMSYAAFSPDPVALYLGDAKIVTDANGCCGVSDVFYAKKQNEGKQEYQTASVIANNLAWNSNLPFSGPYVVESYQVAEKKAVLRRNPYYTGDSARGSASIERIEYVKIVAQTQLDQFRTGQIDILAGVMGAADTRAALALVRSDPAKYRYTKYDRAGYGKLGFRADFGPTGFAEVRQAIMYTINRPMFAQTYTGGYGSVVHGPYYTGYSAYTAVRDEIKLNRYTFSRDSAIEVLEDGGWIYNADGSLYEIEKGGIRYKKLEGYELTRDNLHFATTDGRYRTLKVNGAYYMPLAINYYGTQPNEVTDQLLTDWVNSPTATSDIGMYIKYTQTDFDTGLYGELNRMTESGYNGVPKLNAINFATGFNSAMYDYSFNWTIDREEIAQGYSICFVIDEADFWENYP